MAFNLRRAPALLLSAAALLLPAVASAEVRAARKDSPAALGAHAAAATPRTLIAAASASRHGLLEADLDGDGIRDRIEQGPHSPDLVIRFSSRSVPRRLHARGAVGTIATVDVDRDGDADIIATTGHNRLTIWLNEGGGRFRALRARHARLSGQARARLREPPAATASDITCDGGPIGLTPLEAVVRHVSAGAALAPCPGAVPASFVPRGRTPRGPPSIRIFS